MHRNFAAALGTIFVVSLTGVVEAQQSPTVRSLPQQGKWSVAPSIGTEFNVGGNFVNSASESASGTLLGGTLSATITATTDKKDFNDVYDMPVVAGLGFNYGISNNSEAFGNLRYTHAGSKEFDAINLSATVTYAGTTVTGGGTIRGEFDDYSAMGGEIGYRHFFDAGSGFRPFVSGAVGLKHVSSINLDLKYGGATIIKDVRFYDDSWTGTGALGVGFRYDVSPGIALGFETGIRYEGDLSENNKDVGTTGSYSKVNDAGNRWEIPLMVSANIAF